jgi:uncharacterized coiled-coil protein SlyX
MLLDRLTNINSLKLKIATLEEQLSLQEDINTLLEKKLIKQVNLIENLKEQIKGVMV